MLEEPDTHINSLEYLAILITYAIAQHTLRQNPGLASHTYPTIHIFSDNTTACGWSCKAASSHNKIAKHITHIAGSLQLRARLGLHVSHIKGEDNVVADAISRIPIDSPVPFQLNSIKQAHPILMNCQACPIPPRLLSFISLLLSAKPEKLTIQWLSINKQLIPVNYSISIGPLL
jgi:hypothetical protein